MSLPRQTGERAVNQKLAADVSMDRLDVKRLTSKGECEGNRRKVRFVAAGGYDC